MATYTAPGSKKVNLSDIPTGDSTIVARRILVTKVLPAYDGNPLDKDWYLLPDGRIGDNTTTVLNDIDFYDSSLVDRADRLMDQLPEVPAGSAMFQYGSSLAVAGERENDASIRVSDAGFPEAFSDLTGTVNVFPGDSGEGIRNILAYRDNLYVFKDYRTYQTKNNGSDPSTWEVIPIDSAQGTSVHGTAGVLDSQGQTLDSFLVCTRTGLFRFVGVYGDQRELTYLIEDDWRRISQVYFHTIQLAVDPIQKRLYVALPLDGASTPNYLLMGDFNEGLSWDKIKWSLWSFPVVPTTVWVEIDSTTKESRVKFGSSAGGLYVRNSASRNDFGTAITSYYRPGMVAASPSGGSSIYQLVRLRTIGSGSLYLKLYSIDDTTTVTLPSVSLSASPGKELTRQIGFFTSERASVEFGVTSINTWFHLTRIGIATSILWEMPWLT